MIDALLLSIVVSLSNNGPNGPATCDGGSGYYEPAYPPPMYPDY